MIRQVHRVLCVSVLAQVVGIPWAAASTIPFSNQVAIETPFAFARAVASADFDRDGDLDLVGVSQNSDIVAWWENTAGDASAWIRHDLSLIFDMARDVTVGDIDGDGDPDIVATAFNSDLVSWWENDIDSGAACGSAFCEHTVASLNGADAVEVADIDRDGDLDVVATSRASDLVRWYANSGDGSSWVLQNIATGFDGAQMLWVGDLDDDGDPDVVGGAGNGTGGFAWWENDLGSNLECGADWCAHSLDTGVTEGVAAGDIDGDGDLDLLRSELGALSWWVNDLGDASSWTETPISTTRARTGLAAVDLDGDGDLDVAGLDTGWLENVAGDASVWTARSVPASPDDLFDQEWADIDLDGDLDLVGARSSVGQVAWWRNETLHPSATYPSGSDIGSNLAEVSFLALADLDGDGDDDLAAVSDTGVVRWSENDGTPEDAGWVDRTIYAGVSITGIAAADIDRDGDIDLVVGDFGADAVVWLENDGTPADGGWTTHTVASGFSTPTLVAAADVDADGDLDLVVASRTGDLVSWFENDAPAAGEWTGRIVATGLDFAVGVATSDVDQDGDLDIIAAAVGSDVIVWAENDGSPADGGWSAHTLASAFDGATNVTPCDIDADGDIDVVAVAQLADEVAWFQNDGSPADGEWQRLTVQTGFEAPFRVICVDLDADGDLDIASAAGLGDVVSVWWSDGTPSDGGWQRLDVESGLAGAADAVASDLDRDGMLDLVGTGYTAERIRWWRNAGGQFALPTSDAVDLTTPNAGTADLLLLEIDGVHRGRSGDANAELATLELLFEEGAGDVLTGSELAALVDTVRLYVDDGDGIFEPNTHDANFFSLGTPFVLDTGVMTLTMVDGHPSVQFAVGSDVIWWLAVDLAAGAASATPSVFRVSHLTSASSSAEMATTDLPLSLEGQADVSSSLIAINQPPTLDSPIPDDSAYTAATYSLDVSGSFSDPEGGALTFAAGGLPPSLSLSAGGVISGTPTTADVAGSPYAVTITATDPLGQASMAGFGLTIVASGTIIVDGACTLTDAIRSANTDTDLGNCVGSGGAETIVLVVDVTLGAADTVYSTLIGEAYAGLPDVSSQMRIQAGTGSTIARSASLSCLADGVDHFRLFNVVDGGGLTLTDLILENGCAPHGGAVHVGGSAGLLGAAGAFLSASGTTFRANTAQGTVSGSWFGEGGAVFIDAGADLALADCLFEDNQAAGAPNGPAFGGAVHVSDLAGAISMTATGFTSNIVRGGDGPALGGEASGGAIFSETALDLTDLYFAGNEARGGEGADGANGGNASGGALHIEDQSPTPLLGAVFESNLAAGGDGPAAIGGRATGGALRAPNMILVDVLVAGDAAFGGDGVIGGSAEGGGIALDRGELTRVTIVGAEVRGGSGTTGEGGSVEGGGLYSNDTLDCLQLTLSANQAVGGNSTSGAGGSATAGGAHFDDEPVLLQQSTAIGNAVVAGTGAVAGTATGGGVRFSEYGETLSTILAHNTSSQGGGPELADDCSTTAAPISLGYNVVEAPGNCSFAATGDQVGVAPGIGALGRYGCSVPLPDGGCLPVHPIDIAGAAVDRGSCSALGASVDARGFARPFDLGGVTNADDGCDPGAYEVQDTNTNGIDDAFEIFADGFESGDTTAWSSTTP